MRTMYALALAGLAALFAPQAARAADAPVDAPAQEVAAPGAWTGLLVRGRVIGVLPYHSSARLSVPGSAHVSDRVVPEVDLSYFLTPNFAIETICCATKHHITGRGALNGLDVGKTWAVPFTVTAQYHFTTFGPFKPYVGAGLNYTLYLGEKNGDPAISRLKVKSSFGPALQAGFDYFIDDHWGVNFDVKKIWMQPKVSLAANDVPVRGKAKINPLIVGAGVSYRF